MKVKMRMKGKRSIWGPELLLVVLLPPLTIAAIVLTIYIAEQYRFTPNATIQTGRFGNIEELPSETSKQPVSQSTLVQSPKRSL